MTHIHRPDDVITTIKRTGGPVVIFGAGIVGELLFHVCKDSGIAVVAFTDNNSGMKGQTKCGIEIVHTSELAARHPDCHIIVSAADIGDVVEQMRGLGFTKLYPAGPLVRDADFGAYPLSADYDFVEFAATTAQLCHDAYADPERVFLRSVDIVITERCSMKCQDCSNLMQYYERPQNVELDAVMRGIDSFCEAVDGVNEFRVIGGEPFMNKDIHLTLKRLNDEPKVRKVVIYTNGTILPRPEHIEQLQNKKILLLITDYGDMSRKMTELLALLDEKKVAYFRRDADNWTQCSTIEPHNRTVEQQKHVFKNCCAKNLFTIIGNKLFRCPWAANADRLKAIPDIPDDYVDLFSGTVEQRKAALRHYLFTKDYLESCDFCQGRFLAAPQIEPGIQVKTPIPYVKRQ